MRLMNGDTELLSDIRNLAGAMRDTPLREQAERVLKAIGEPQEPGPSAALFAFAAWLTCREQSVIFGSTHDAAPAAELVGRFCESQGWSDPPEGWENHFQPYPAD